MPELVCVPMCAAKTSKHQCMNMDAMPCVGMHAYIHVHLVYCLRYGLHCICFAFPRLYRAPACLITCLPSTCLPFPLAYQAPAGLLPRFTKHLPCFPMFIQHMMAFPRLAKHLPGFFPRFTKHLLGFVLGLLSTCKLFSRFTKHLLCFSQVY